MFLGFIQMECFKSRNRNEVYTQDIRIKIAFFFAFDKSTSFLINKHYLLATPKSLSMS